MVGIRMARPRAVVTLSWVVVLAVIVTLLESPAAQAATVTTVPRDDTGARMLAEEMVVDQGTLVDASFVHVPPSGSPHGTADRLSFFPTAGDRFAILTTGDARFAPQEETFASADLGGPSVRGNTDFDVTVLAIDLAVPAGRNCLRFDFAFYSEEYPDFVGSAFNDAFIAELDTSTWTTSGSQISAPENFAFDDRGEVISINSTGATSMSRLNAGGTAYGGATVLLEAATPVTDAEHTLYLSIFDQGDRIYDSATFIDNLRFEQAAPGECRPGARARARTPLIFLPGITGSFLADGEGNEVWPQAARTGRSISDDHLDVLALAADGESPAVTDDPAYDIRPMVEQGIDGLIDRVTVRFLVDEDVYDSTFEMLAANGYTRGENLFPFAFDWRLSIDHNADRLLDLIDEIRASTGAERVNIMAHSQGGLVTSAALKRAAAVGKVDRVVTLGTPYLGATRSLGVLVYREPCQADTPINRGCFLNRRKAQQLVQNWPGFLALLPSRGFYETDGSPVFRLVDDDGDGQPTGLLPFAEVRERIRPFNLPLADAADALHQRIDRWDPADPDVALFRVVGDRSGTIRRVVEYQEEQCPRLLWWRDCELVDAIQFQMGNGDGTVPLNSADLVAEGFDYRGTGQNAYASAVGHGALPNDPGVMGFALAFLAGSGGGQPAAAGLQVLATDNEAEAEARRSRLQTMSAPANVQADDEDVRFEPRPLEGTEAVIRGPLEGLVEDHEGGQLGLADAETGFEVATIPGATYFTATTSRSWFFVHDGVFTGDWIAAADGEAAIVLREYAEDRIVSTTASERFPVATGARVSLAFTRTPNPQDLRIEIDDDGDGSADRVAGFASAVTGTAAEDVVAPTTMVGVNLTEDQRGRRFAHVTMTATDEGGSGVDRIEYALDSSETVALYDGPFTVPAYGELYVRAIDRAGNVEAPYQVVVLDDAPSRPDLVQEYRTVPSNHAGRLAFEGDVDWWGYELEGGRYQFQLIGLPDDYDLALHDADGALVATSRERGMRSERIVATLPAGRFLLEVSGHDGAHAELHDYRLNVTRLGD